MIPSELEPEFLHIPVLSQAVIQGLNLRPGGHYLDATVGGGGHSRLILEAAPESRITALDRDQQALQAARSALQPYGERVQFHQSNFADYEPGSLRFDGILADLGVSSAQLDQPQRGFSFRADAPLDMRMDQRQTLTAAELVNTASAEELADIFYYYGEERFARRIARRIVQHRPLHTTAQLASLVSRALPSRSQSIHPATRVFQALRIAVNRELESLEQFLERSPHWLVTGGRLAVISFHSLEDRRVKHGLRDHSLLQVLTKKPILPASEEISANPRARSAKLRLAQRLDPLEG